MENIIFYITMLIIDITLLIIYIIYIKATSNTKTFFNHKIKYSTEYTKYYKMQKQIKKIVFKKQLQ